MIWGPVSKNLTVQVSSTIGYFNLYFVRSLLAGGAVHHHLIEQKLRLKVGIILETGEAR